MSGLLDAYAGGGQVREYERVAIVKNSAERYKREWQYGSARMNMETMNTRCGTPAARSMMTIGHKMQWLVRRLGRRTSLALVFHLLVLRHSFVWAAGGCNAFTFVLLHVLCLALQQDAYAVSAGNQSLVHAVS